MRRPNHLTITAVSRICHSLGYARCLAFAVLLAGSLTGLARAIETTSSLDVDRWSKHPALQPFDVAGKGLLAELFLVRTRGELPEEAGVVVHGEHNGVFLVSGEPTTVWGFARRGCAVLPLTEVPAVPIPPGRKWTWIETRDPNIAAMVAKVEWAGVSDKIRWLVDFGTRYSFAANHADVAQFINDVLASYGLQTTLHPCKAMGTTIWNVEAIQTGTLYPNSCVIICGHFDSISEDPMNLAPGADDNATGAAAVLTAAEILSEHAFE